MIDISGISGELITELAFAYRHAAAVFSKEPAEASEKKQRKIRKWICRHYADLASRLPKEANIFSAQYSDKDVLLLLKECLALEKSLENKKIDRFETDFAALDISVRSALRHLLDLEFWPETVIAGNNVRVITDDTPAFRRTLILKNANAVPMGKEGYYCRNLGMVLKKETQKYCFYGELEALTEETVSIFALTFEDAEVEIEVYNACDQTGFWNNPWELLQTIGYLIWKKAELPGDYCNSQEKALLPLIREIVALGGWLNEPEQDRFSFPELKKTAERYGYDKAEALLSKLETIKPGESAFYNTAKKLIAFLCKEQCEPAWREIYNQILASQAEYPDRALCERELLEKTRCDIQTLMEAKGYSGTYPDFVKDGAMNGIHLAQSYNMTYFVGMEKRVRYHIHCQETIDVNNSLAVQFLCGTALLKKGEADTDVYDCLFDAKGRRLFHRVDYSVPLQTEEDCKTGDLETSVTIAVKKAECIKLNKAEQRVFYGQMMPGWSLFGWIFLIGGGLFAIMMTVGMMLLSVIVTIAFGFFGSILEMLCQMPWGMLFAIAWIGFGGAMGLVEVLARRK